MSDSPDVVAISDGVSHRSATDAARESATRTEARASLNAFITMDPQYIAERSAIIDALPLGEVPLRGVTLAVKDNIHVAGLPNSAGTTSLREFFPNDTSPVVESLQRMGAIVFGKAGLHELAYGITSANGAFGAIRNPVDETKIPGGSSGGTAAAVAAGLVTAGLGTDTGGSVRLPAAMTGIVGFRPTVGLYSSAGVTIISNTRDTVGVMARNVSDTALLHSIITARPRLKRTPAASLRIGIPDAYFCEDLDPQVAQIFAKFIRMLEVAGANLVYANLTLVPELNSEISLPICMYETSKALPRYLDLYNTGISIKKLIGSIVSPDVASIMEAVFGGTISEESYVHALNSVRPRLRNAYAEYFSSNGVDVIVFPTSPLTARNIDGISDGVIVNGRHRDTFEAYIRNSDPASNAGIPAISIPMGITEDGLPVGVEIGGPEGADEKLLAAALGIEAELRLSGSAANLCGTKHSRLKLTPTGGQEGENQ